MSKWPTIAHREMIQNNFYGKMNLANNMVNTAIDNDMEYIDKNYVRLRVYMQSNSIEVSEIELNHKHDIKHSHYL
jgi:hypothetical protein